MDLLRSRVTGRLKGKTAWLSGGRRIGRVVAHALAEQGVNLVLSYRSSRTEAEQTAAAARRLGVKALVVQCDMAARADVERVAEEAFGVFPRVDILVNMASVFEKLALEEVSAPDWNANFGAHVLGTFWPIQVVGPRMPRGGHVVNVADRTSIGRHYRGYVPYIATKAAVAALTRSAALELGSRGVFVNAIAPGPILRPPDVPNAQWKKLRESSPVKFPINDREAVEQFALLVLFLCTQTMVSGFTYPLDQGQNL